MSGTPISRPPIKGGKYSKPEAEFISQVYKICFSQSQSGLTAKRPTTNLYVGQRYFDTTLNKPVWLKTVSPAVWVDATGAVV